MTGLPLLAADLGPGILAGFTGRVGGCSEGAWAGLDLALHVGDDPAHVADNRRRVAEWAGVPVVFARQVHGVRSAVVPADGLPFPDAYRADLGSDDGGYDALVTDRSGTALGVLVADCVPVLLADAEAGVVATAHAGRPGLLAGVLTGVLRAMERAGARAERVRVALGPSAGPCCYELPQHMADDAAALIPATRSHTTWGTPSMDLRAGCRAVLEAAGVGDVRSVGGWVHHRGRRAVFLPEVPGDGTFRGGRQDGGVTGTTSTTRPVDEVRRAQVRAGLEAVRARIAAGCAAAGRDPAEVTLVVVTKTYPAADVALLAELGVRDVGENRDQEAAPKHEACAALGLRWHFIGQLQSNKARSVATYADLVHSVDRVSLVRALGRSARDAGRTLGCLLQVSLDGAAGRGGALIADVPALADAVAAEEGLALHGLMAVAPLGADPRVSFSALPRLRDSLLPAHPEARFISAGMSGDLEAALAEGATHLRVGTAVLGARPPLG